MNASLPSGTVTFLYTDIEQSTEVLKRLGRQRYGEALSRHNEIVRATLAEHGGVELELEGDSFLAVFRSAGLAAAAALALQRAVAAEPWPDEGQIRIRIGVHTGDARPGDEGYVGMAVHQAPAFGGLAHGGQIVLSATAAALVEHELPADVSLRAVGETRPPGLDRPERLYQLVAPDLPDHFPSLAPSSAGPPRAGLPLIEREAELAAIRALVDGARTGTGRLVAIEGEAGLGKTRLVNEARTLGEQAAMRVLSARGGELEHEFSYGVVRQLFEPALRTIRDEERAELLAGAAALAAPLFEGHELTGEGSGTVESSFAVLHGLFWLAGNLASTQPLLLLVDDLHWADAPSLRWLTYLLRRLEGLPILVVAGMRPPEQSNEEALISEIVSDPGTMVLRPATLTVEGAARFIEDVLEVEPDHQFTEAAREVTGGNPLLLRALLEALRSEGVPPKADAVPRVREIGPEAVSRAVQLRLSRLPAEATALAQALAVLGDGASLPHTATLAGLDRDVAGHAATMLGRSNLVRFDRTLEFVHPVVRAAVYSELAPAEREAAHAHAARVLYEAGAPDEQVAAHLLLTPPGGEERVVRVLREAAERSSAHGDPGGAAAYLRRALEEPPADEERGDILLQLGLNERLLESPVASEHLREAHTLAADPHRRATIALELGRTLFYSLQVEEAVAVFEAAIVELGDSDLGLRRALEASLFGITVLFPQLYPLARAQLDRIAKLPLEGDIGSRMLLATTAYHDARRLEPLEECVARAHRALEGGPLWAEENASFAYATVTLTAADRFDEVAEVYDEAFADARIRGSISTFAVAAIFRAYLEIFTGHLAEAEADARAAIEASESHGLATGIPYATSYLIEALTERGELEEAAAVADRFDASGGPSNAQWFYLDVRGRLRLRLGRAQEALDDLLEGARHYDSIGGLNPSLTAWRSHAALAYLTLGEKDRAVELVREEVELARRWGAPRAIAQALRIEGLAVGGREGLELLREAADTIADSGARLERAKSLTAFGSALRRSGQRADARDVLRAGLELAHACGAKPIEERAQEELLASGARRRPLMVSGVESLTPSEKRVATMAAEGMTNRDIAQALFVTPKTVEVHLSSVYRKLGISSPAQLPEILELEAEAVGGAAR